MKHPSYAFAFFVFALPSCILPSPEQERLRMAALEAGAETASVTVSAESRHAISPYIFGGNWLKPGLIRDSGYTINRWGGNRSSKYNWKKDLDSAGNDWFYINGGGGHEGTAEAKKGYAKWIQGTLDAGAEVNFTIPTGPWLANVPDACSFPKSFESSQEKFDRSCGNGKTADGKGKIWGNDPEKTMTKNSPDLQRELVSNIKKLFGAKVKFISLDNEPGLWHETHRDTVPKGISADDLVAMNVAYASAVKSVDPAFQVIGWSAWGVLELAGSNVDYTPPGEDGYKRYDNWGSKENETAQKFAEVKKHGGQSQMVYYLEQMKAAEKKAGRRLIDAIDFHLYPETYASDAKGNNVRLSENLKFEPGVAEKQVDAVREWWDPEYVNRASWTAAGDNKKIFWDPWHPVVPALKKIIAEHYPGTKLCLNEYDTGSRDYFHGALIRVLVLGTFMREDLFMAQSWYGPQGYMELAYKLFRNYDDKGGHVGGKFVETTSDKPDLVTFAARDGKKTYLLLVNKSQSARFTTNIRLPIAAKTVQTYTLAERLGQRIKEEDPANVGGNAFTVRMAPFSASLVVID
jgi:hypothetical protein